MLPELWRVPGIGWPLKSYGFMLMVGFLSAVYLAMRRASKVRCNPDEVLNCSFIALIAGVIGARIFYVVHYWNEYFALQPGSAAKVWAVLNLTQGGLEFIGGLIGATVCIVLYLWRKNLSIRLYTDILSVSTLWALGIARVGCFLNGCCFGGLCDAHGGAAAAAAGFGVQFPFGSPSFVRQWERREVAVPAELIHDTFVNSPSMTIWPTMPLSREVLAMTPEQIDGPELAYERAKKAYERAVKSSADAKEIERLKAEMDLRARLRDDHRLKISGLMRAERMPSRFDPARPMTTLGEVRQLAARFPARRVHPTQLYSTVSAVLLSIFLGRVFYRRKRHGVVFGLLLVLYPVSRFLLEIIRADNPHDAFGLTISQSISVGMFLVGCVYLIVLYKMLPVRSPRAVPFEPEIEGEAPEGQGVAAAKG